MPGFVARIERAPLVTLAILLAVVKFIQFAIDSTALFYFDSGSFILNALGLAFKPERSYVYGYLIRIFAVPFHSLRAIVAMQVVMGGITAWLLGFVLLRFLKVRAWIAILAALAFAFDPVQIVHEHLVVAETPTLLTMAIFLVVASAVHTRARPVAAGSARLPGNPAGQFADPVSAGSLTRRSVAACRSLLAAGAVSSHARTCLGFRASCIVRFDAHFSPGVHASNRTVRLARAGLSFLDGLFPCGDSYSDRQCRR